MTVRTPSSDTFLRLRLTEIEAKARDHGAAQERARIAAAIAAIPYQPTQLAYRARVIDAITPLGSRSEPQITTPADCRQGAVRSTAVERPGTG